MKAIQKREEKEEKEVNTNVTTIHVFFVVFLRTSKILIFKKNNSKNTKNILTVIYNSILVLDPLLDLI
jgi:uncharacterized membrane protein YozB (DUF420 family)